MIDEEKNMKENRWTAFREKRQAALWAYRSYQWEELFQLSPQAPNTRLCSQAPAEPAMAVPVRKDEDLFGVLMFLFYFYTGLIGVTMTSL